MKVINFELHQQTIKVIGSPSIVAGSKNYIFAKFSLKSDDWQKPITAIFGDYTQILDDDNGCIVPWESIQSAGTLKVSAFCGDLHTANTAYIRITEAGYKEGETPKEPTPDVYSQLASMVQSAIDTANGVRYDADSGKLNGEPGKDGFSPIANVKQMDIGAEVSITDKTGTTTATVLNGRDGGPGTSAGFGAITATSNQIGYGETPIASVETSGPDTAKNFLFYFGIPEGKPGDSIVPVPTQEDAGKVLSVSQYGSGLEYRESTVCSEVDDTVISTKNAWSSQKIIETLCPRFEVTGNPVTCNPVEGYPLDVKANFGPIQSGEGNPSPENVQPISGRNSLEVTRCGKNLVGKTCKVENFGSYIGLNITWINDALVLSLRLKPEKEIPPGISFGFIHNYTNEDTGKTQTYAEWALNDANPGEFLSSTLSRKNSIDYLYMLGCYPGNSETWNKIFDCFDVQLELGSTTTIYEPYQGDAYDIALPETVYGGTVDVVMGEGEKTWEYIASYNGEVLPGEWISDRDVYAPDTKPTTGAEVAYKLTTPEPFTVARNPISALPGVNTIYTDVDYVTVSGRSDPIAYAQQKISDAISQSAQDAQAYQKGVP